MSRSIELIMSEKKFAYFLQFSISLNTSFRSGSESRLISSFPLLPCFFRKDRQKHDKPYLLVSTLCSLMFPVQSRVQFPSDFRVDQSTSYSNVPSLIRGFDLGGGGAMAGAGSFLRYRPSPVSA